MKKRIKKYTSILLVILLAVTAVSLAACGSDNSGPADDGSVRVITDGDGNVLTVEDGGADTAEDGIVDTLETDGVKYVLYSDGTMIVSGKGEARNYWDDRVKKVIAEEGITKVDFNNSKSLTEIVIPGSVKIIYEGSFGGCSNLTKVSIQEGVVIIQKKAFWGCTSLAEIELPDSLIYVGEEAFSDTVLFEEVDGVRYVGSVACGYTDIQGSLKLREGTRIIADNAFSRDLSDEHNNITSATIPDGAVRIGARAFENSLLTEINVPDSVISIGENAFGQTQLGMSDYVGKVAYHLNLGSDVKDLVLKEDTVGIADCAFAGSDFDTVTLPAALKLIGDEAKINVKNQEEIVIPDGVTYIGMDAITGVKNIILPESVTFIAYFAFDFDATIIAPKGSYAETYALENEYQFKER